jgi:hypoxanthine phosphoribosyltransferase
MSGRVKIVLSKHVQNDAREFQRAFDDLMGEGKGEIHIILPKMVKLYNGFRKVHQVLDILVKCESFWSVFVHHQFWKEDIQKFMKSIADNMEVRAYTEQEFLPADYGSYLDPKTHPKHTEIQEQLNMRYMELKKMPFVQEIVDSSNRMAEYKNVLSAVYAPEGEAAAAAAAKKNNTTQGDFLNSFSGTVNPFTFSSLDLKYIWSEERFTGRQMVLSVLAHFYWVGLDTFDLLNSPDVDMQQFSGVLLKALDALKRKLPRCDDAFRILENSVGLLQTNFKQYFRDSKLSNNPSLLMQNFIIDVAQTQNMNLSVKAKADFKRIIDYLINANSGSTNPHFRAMIELLQKNRNVLDE